MDTAANANLESALRTACSESAMIDGHGRVAGCLGNACFLLVQARFQFSQPMRQGRKRILATIIGLATFDSQPLFKSQ